jgi:hypothetical protein
LERAAETGHHLKAASQLANLYLTHQHPDVPTNVEKGVDWLKQAANMGCRHSAYQLSGVYQSGIVPVNHQLSRKWEQVAAKLGHDESSMQIGDITAKQALKRLQKLDKKEGMDEFLSTEESRKCSNPLCDKEERGDARFAPCEGCRSVKYCSNKCQKCHYRAGHKIECRRLNENKNQLLEMNRNRLCPLVECFNPECKQRENNGELFSKCSRCKHAKYCSKPCQRQHWNHGHRRDCEEVLEHTADADRLLENLSIGD